MIGGYIIDKTQYTLIKIPIKEIIKQEYNVKLTQDQEIDNEYLIIKMNKIGLTRIDEKSLNRLMWQGRHHFVILSAWRSSIKQIGILRLI